MIKLLVSLLASAAAEWVDYSEVFKNDVPAIKDEAQFMELLNEEKDFFVFFYADWCYYSRENAFYMQ